MTQKPLTGRRVQTDKSCLQPRPRSFPTLAPSSPLTQKCLQSLPNSNWLYTPLLQEHSVMIYGAISKTISQGTTSFLTVLTGSASTSEEKPDIAGLPAPGLQPASRGKYCPNQSSSHKVPSTFSCPVLGSRTSSLQFTSSRTISYLIRSHLSSRLHDADSRSSDGFQNWAVPEKLTKTLVAHTHTTNFTSLASFLHITKSGNPSPELEPSHG